jgi:hypothetical protein
VVDEIANLMLQRIEHEIGAERRETRRPTVRRAKTSMTKAT